jgi:hypothetical protein
MMVAGLFGTPQHAPDSSASPVLVALSLLVALSAYFLPTIVAVVRRRVPNTGSLVVINAFLGWTFVGWVVALAMAVRSRPAGSEACPSKLWAFLSQDIRRLDVLDVRRRVRHD